jgi:signal transduction histidine kinase
MQPELLHVLDLATLRDWGGAKAVLEALDDPVAARLYALISELDLHDDRRRKATTNLRHEIGNALSIVRANLEGIIDGVLPASPQRLNGMREALAAASLLLDDLHQEPERERKPGRKPETFDLHALVAAQIAMVAELAESKGVSIENSCRGSFFADAARSAQTVRNALIGSIRFTPPGGTVAIGTPDASGTADLTITIDGLPESATIPRPLVRGRGIRDVSLASGKLRFGVRLQNAPAAG